MQPNDVARCQGTVTEYIDGGKRTTTIAMHPQCIGCARRIAVVPDTNCRWIDAPLGLLAKPDALCSARQNKP